MGYISDYVKAHGGVTRGSEPRIVELIQKALLWTGAQLVVDGEIGDITEGAIKHYQAAHLISPAGWVGPNTAMELDKELERGGSTSFPLPSVAKDAPWVSHMRAITGTKEVPGSEDSPLIMSWRQEISKAYPEMAKYCAGYTHDSIPWCGLAMAIVMVRSGIRPPFGVHDTEKFLYAASWAKFGDHIDAPIPGCVMVFSRAGGGHVSLLEKLEGKVAYIRGGNQTDAVNVMKKNLDGSFVAARWPTGFAIPSTMIAGDVSNAVGPGSFA